jgi:hypothetical protein
MNAFADPQVMKHRIRYGLTHLVISATVVAAVIAVVLKIWYPGSLAALEGVGLILLIVVLVDVCLGPLLTSVVASPKKPRRELVRDLAIIALIQVAALAYGVHSTFAARPVFVVYNTDRFDIVTSSELVWDEGVRDGDPELADVPLDGPRWVQTLPPKSIEARNRLMFQAVGGGPDLKQYPELYRKWPGEPAIVRERMKDLETLRQHMQPAELGRIEAVLAGAGLREDEVAYVPLLGRQRIGVALLRRSDLSVVAAVDVRPPY